MDKPFKIKDAKVGDECYFRASFQKAPLKGKIVAIYESEDAVGIMTYTIGCRVAHESNVAWTEAEVKKLEYVPPPRAEWIKK